MSDKKTPQEMKEDALWRYRPVANLVFNRHPEIRSITVSHEDEAYVIFPLRRDFETNDVIKFGIQRASIITTEPE